MCFLSKKKKKETILKLCKVIVIGDPLVGKSVMLTFLVTGKYILKPLTIGVDFYVYKLKIKDNSFIGLQIWDFSGIKRFRFLITQYFLGSDLCLLCYDITNYRSFENLTEWYKMVKNIIPNVNFMIVGMKHDLGTTKREVSMKVSKNFAHKMKIPYVLEVSAKTGYNMDKFIKILSKLLRNNDEKK
ncbi:MAG: Rab family GTPase [Promethearchaeota archaeon]